jgi:hypothetical protein
MFTERRYEMQFSTAGRVKEILISAGHNSERQVDHEIGHEVTERTITLRHRSETGRKASDLVATKGFRSDFFVSTHVGPDEALVSYQGSPLVEPDRFRLYRLALENCALTVTEEDDPEREGRRLLRVKR